MCKCDCHIKKSDCQRSEKEGSPNLDCLWNWSVNISIIIIFLVFYFFFFHHLCCSRHRVWKRTVHFIHLLFVISAYQSFIISLIPLMLKGRTEVLPLNQRNKTGLLRGVLHDFCKWYPTYFKAHVASCLFCSLSVYKTVGKEFFVPYISDWWKEISDTFLRTSLLWPTEILLKFVFFF